MSIRRRIGLGVGRVGPVVAMWLAIVASGCTPAVPGAALDFGDVEVANGTTMPVTVVVNGAARVQVLSGTTGGIRAAELPPKPWAILVQHAISGRVLLSLTVDADPFRDDSSASGFGARVDLSCGRLDAWVGPPMHGPMPEAGRPGDCDP